MAKPKKAEAMPAECCGVCKFSHMQEAQLECFGMPPIVLADEAGDLMYLRSVMVEPRDNICHLFTPRMHS